MRLWGVALMAMLAWCAPAGAVTAPEDMLPDYDVRGPAAQGLMLGHTGSRLTAPSDAAARRIAGGYLRDRMGRLGLDADDLDALPSPSVVTSPAGIRRLTYRQELDGLEVYGAYVRIGVAPDGSVINVTGAPEGDLSVPATTPDLSRSSARWVGRAGIGGLGTVSDLDLVVFPDKGADRLAYRMDVDSPDSILYEVVVDAGSGELLTRRSLTSFANQASIYTSFPDSGGAPTVVTFGGGGLGGDPTWIDDTAGGTLLRGNNAYAYADTAAPNGVNGSEDVPSVGGDWNFPVTFFNQSECPAYGCTWDSTNNATKLTNEDQATTQLFWYVNHYHDYLEQAPIGFGEPEGNFEQIDTGAPGLGNDRVLAEANDSSGTNNANMTNPADGTSPRMQMFFWNLRFDENGADDATIPYHEYTHGMTQRIMAPGTLSGTSQGGAMHEALGDFFALDLVVSEGGIANPAGPGDVFLARYSVGDQGVNNDGKPGLRTQAIDCTVGAAASDCPASGTAGPGGYTFSDLGRIGLGSSIHSNGEIWSQTMWDLREKLGRDTARSVITEGLRLSPTNPSFLQMRNAILAAAAPLGVDQDLLWEVFAARGMGFSAVDPGAGSVNAADDFTVPRALLPDSRVITDAPPLGDGDGSPEPGETVALTQRLREIFGTGVAAGTTGRLSSATPGVVVGEPTATWGAFGPAATLDADAPFAVTIPNAHACEAPVDLSLHLDLPGAGGSFDLALPAMAVGARTFVASTDPGLPLAIPDNNPAGVTSSFTAPLAAGTITDLRVKIPSLAHSFVGDLVITLTHVSTATSVVLASRPGPGAGGSSANDFTDVVFSDAAPTAIESIANAPEPITGTFRPDQPLSAFDGETTAGVWTLKIVDSAGTDTGSLNSWQLSPAPTCAAATAALPEATTADASLITATGATLNGTVDPNGTATEYLFEYGPTTTYGTRTAPVDAGAGTEPVAATAAITGLTVGTTYHVRALARRSGVVVAQGADKTFTAVTPATPTASPAATATPTATPTVTPTATPTPPPVKRRVTFKYVHGTFKGKVRPKGACATGQRVKIFRKKKGKDPKVASARTNAKGKYAKRQALGPGRYYAKIGARTVAGTTCLAAKSKGRTVKGFNRLAISAGDPWA